MRKQVTDKGQIETKRTEEQTPINEPSQIEPIFDRKKLLEITGTRVSEGMRVSPCPSLLKDAHAPALEGYQRPLSSTEKLLAELQYG